MILCHLLVFLDIITVFRPDATMFSVNRAGRIGAIIALEERGVIGYYSRKKLNGVGDAGIQGCGSEFRGGRHTGGGFERMDRQGMAF